MEQLPPVPFLDLLGIRHKGMKDGRAVTEVELVHHHMNRLHAAHGGVIATLLDTAMVGAARASAAVDVRVATLEMKTSFMRLGQGTLRCEAQCLHHSSSLAFCEAVVRDSDGRLVASGSATYRYLPVTAFARAK